MSRKIVKFKLCNETGKLVAVAPNLELVGKKRKSRQQAFEDLLNTAKKLTEKQKQEIEEWNKI